MKLPRQGLVGAAIGAAVTAGVFVAVFEGKVSLANDRGRVEVAAGQSAQIAPGGDAKASPAAPALTRTDVVRLAPGAQPGEPVAQVASAPPGAGSAEPFGPRGPQSRFAREVRDPQWAAAQEQAILARLEKNIGIPRSRVELECRTRCCYARMARSFHDEHERELASSVGLGGTDAESALNHDDGNGLIGTEVCFPRSDAAHPDRGAERDALLAAIHGDLGSCGHGLDHEVTISMELTLDESGAVTRADTRSDPTGEPVAACVERAVVGAAAFAPASEVSRLPLSVTLPLR